MTREVDLVSYLPLFMRDFKEIEVTLEAENPEFILVWDALDQALRNEFIATADEYGISRFEKILGILPFAEDTLESRRARVSARWFDSIPYTIRMLLQKLKTICGDTGFTVAYDFETEYTITVVTDLENFGQVEELESILNSWLPENINFDSCNEIPCNSDGIVYFGGGIVYCDEFWITNDFDETEIINGVANLGGGLVYADRYFITNDFRLNEEIMGKMMSGGGVVDTATVLIMDDFNKFIEINE